MVKIGYPANCSSLGNVLNVLVWSEVAATLLWVLVARRQRSLPIQEDPGPEVHLQITEACEEPCSSCHMEARSKGEHVPLKEIKKRLEQLKNSGIKRVALGGGEVTLHPELAEIIIFGRELGLTLGATTSGQVPLSEHTRSSLNLLHQLNVSLDGLASIYQQSRRSAGAETALELIRSLSKQNTVRVGINLLLTRMTLPGLEETVAAAVEAGARDIQLLRLKPVGRAFKNYQENRLQPMDVAGLWERIQALIRRFPGVLFRGDCSMVPLFSLSPIDPHRLQAFAGAGCHGGDALFSIAPSGQKTPCSFWKGPLDNDWKSGPAQKPCQDCSWRALCRGGCHAVSGSALLPDPECPRVMACQS